MELKEYYKILKSNISVVIYTIIIAVVVVYAWSVKASQTYNASLLLNISRTDTQSTTDYRYDQFYRTQADDKFSETIVEWLKSPGVAQDIFAKAGVNSSQKTMRELSKSFRAEKLSSEIIGVNFSTQSEDEAKKISAAISDVVVNKTNILNDSRDPDWFKVDLSNFIALKNTQDLRVNLIIAALFGLFLGILIAFMKHYISE